MSVAAPPLTLAIDRLVVDGPISAAELALFGRVLEGELARLATERPLAAMSAGRTPLLRAPAATPAGATDGTAGLARRTAAALHAALEQMR